MSEQLDPKTFDLIGVLSGRDYPELEVPVYFNEGLGQEWNDLRNQISAAEARGDSASLDELDARKEALTERTRNEKYVVTLQSIPEKVYRSIIEKVNEDFPNEIDLLGREKPNPEGDAMFTRELWKAYIRTVTTSDGAKNHVGEKEIDALIADAPAVAQEAITKGISELRTGSKAGFEYAAKEVDFLSPA